MAKKVKVKEDSKKNNEVREITDSEFESVIKDNNAVIIDFFAEWCMPCVMMVPVIE